MNQIKFKKSNFYFLIKKIVNSSHKLIIYALSIYPCLKLYQKNKKIIIYSLVFFQLVKNYEKVRLLKYQKLPGNPPDFWLNNYLFFRKKYIIISFSLIFIELVDVFPSFFHTLSYIQWYEKIRKMSAMFYFFAIVPDLWGEKELLNFVLFFFNWFHLMYLFPVTSTVNVSETTVSKIIISFKKISQILKNNLIIVLKIDYSFTFHLKKVLLKNDVGPRSSLDQQLLTLSKYFENLSKRERQNIKTYGELMRKMRHDQALKEINKVLKNQTLDTF